MTPAELTDVLRLHAAWRLGDPGGVCANLRDADLRGANLGGAYLGDAYLGGANLGDAYLVGANLVDVRGLVPAVVLLASWGTVSPDLCRDLMRWDADNHPDPGAFDRWAAGGPCPYDDVLVARAAQFAQTKEHWSPGPCPRPYDLMVRVLAEKCPTWTDEQMVAFEARFAAPKEGAS